MSDLLYSHQSQWTAADDVTGLFKSYAAEVGLDGEAFAVCLDSRAFQAEVQADTREARDTNVLGVPMFFFYGPGRDAVVLGAQPFATFRSLIDSLLQGAANDRAVRSTLHIPGEVADVAACERTDR